MNNKNYTEEELMYLERSWGKVSITKIANKLNRKERAIQLKAFRLGLGAMLDNKDYLIGQDVINILGIDRKTFMKHVKERGLLAKEKYLTKNKKCLAIQYEDFISWVESNLNYWDATKSDILALELLGVNKGVLERKIKEDRDKLNRKTLLEKDIELIKELYENFNTYEEIAIKLNKDYETIKWKIHTLIQNEELEQNTKRGRLVRSINRSNYGWTKWQDDTLVKLFREGKTLKEISEVVGKSLSATKTRNQVLTKRIIKDMVI